MEYQQSEHPSEHRGAADTMPLGAAPAPAPNGVPGASVGSAPPAAPAGPVIGKRIEWFPRKNDHDDAANNFRAAYPGFFFQIWVNYPQRLSGDLLANDEDRDLQNDRIRRALKQIVVAHNGWRMPDEATGAEEPLPPPTDDAFWDLIPNELATAMMLFVLRAGAALPNSMLPPRGNSRRG